MHNRRSRASGALLSDEAEELQKGIGRVGNAEVRPGVVVEVGDVSGAVLASVLIANDQL